MIFCDESGNSGANLLDKEQPFFVLASNDMSKEDAQNFLSLLQAQQAEEVKFKTLRKTDAGKRRLLDFFNNPQLAHKQLAFFAIHKRFMIFTKLVDLIAENILYELESGIDLYKGGANIAMSNMLYYCTPTFCGEMQTNAFLSAFVNMVRYPSADAIEAYYEEANELKLQCGNNDFSEDLIPFTNRNFFPIWKHALNQKQISTLDPASTALFWHINHWGIRKEDRFEIMHDKSKPVLASQENFQKMLAIEDEASSLVGYDRRQFLFPLRAKSLQQGDSKTYPQIQIADVCAGACSYMLRNNDDLSKELRSITDRLVEESKWSVALIHPSTAITPEQLGTDSNNGTNPIDPITQRLNSY